MFSLSSDRRAVSVPGRALINGSHIWGFLFSNSFCIDDNFPVYHVEMMNYTVVETLLECCSEKSRPSQVTSCINFWKVRHKKTEGIIYLFKCVAFKIIIKKNPLISNMGLSSSSNSIVMLEAWSPVPQNVTLFGNKVVADIIRDHTGVGGSLIQCDRCL